MEYTFSWLAGAVAILLTICYFSLKLKKASRAPPQAGGGRPIIGHLHLLAGPNPPHITLGNLVDKHGPIFTIKLGVHQTLIISSSEMAKECFTTNDKSFASRPKSLAFEILGYNYAIFGFAPYGDYWRNMRKLATLELLSNHRLASIKHVREAEVRFCIKGIYQEWIKNKSNSDKLLVEMKTWFRDIALNLILKIIVGKRYTNRSSEDEESGSWKDAMREYVELAGKFSVSDAFPYLRWLDIGGVEKEMKANMKKLDLVVDEWLQERKRKKEVSGGRAEEDEDFMCMLLSVLEDSKELSSIDADTINKATCLGLILAASDTTTVTLTWALSLLLNNRDVLKKAQEELDFHVGKERQVNESDMNKLVFLQAIIKETMRLYPAAPLGLPHQSTQDCVVGGYHIPAGTRLLFNFSKIQRDGNVWLNPSQFRPERFLDGPHKNVELRGQNFELLPFSSGRRMCPGVSFALQVLNLTLATFLQSFEFETPLDMAMDMTESVAITNLKATPVDVLLTPRLPAHLY